MISFLFNFVLCRISPVLLGVASGLLFGFIMEVAAQENASLEPGVASHAQAAAPGSQISGFVDLAGTGNPKGIGIVSGIEYRNSYRYSSQYDMASAYRQAGLGFGINPAYLQPGVNFEWMPLLFLILRVSWDGYYFYGTNGGVLSFSSPDAPFGDSVRRAREGTEESGFGSRVLFQPTLRARLGNILLRNQTEIAYYRFPGKGPYFLELEYDTLLKNKDRLFANRMQALADLGKGDAVTLLGPFYEIVRAEAAHLTRKRVGIAGYSEQVPQLSFFRKTHYFVQTGYNLEDRNRGREFFLVTGLGGTFGL